MGFNNLSFFQEMSEKKVKVMKLPSFIYGAIQIASGKFNTGAFYNPCGHDVAALKVIIEEA
jgi:fructose-1,6-bisphosphatase/inositol monophosphatase family enzyme